MDYIIFLRHSRASSYATSRYISLPVDCSHHKYRKYSSQVTHESNRLFHVVVKELLKSSFVLKEDFWKTSEPAEDERRETNPAKT